MKKGLLLFTGVLLAASGTYAQITLNSFSYAAPTTDSFKTTVAATSYPSFAPATNASWDLSTITDSSANILVYHVASSGLSSTYADSSGYAIGSYTYQGDLLSSVTGSGIMEYGLSTPGAGYSLTSVTTGLNDSLWISNQVAAYSSSATVLKFPATMSTSWSSSYMDSLHFRLTVLIASYSNAPGTVKSYTTVHDTVIGWGQIKVKTTSGGTSGYMNVLQVRRQTTRLDSIFIYGALATSLSAIGVNATQTTTTYEQDFYRADEISPLVRVTFSDSANTTPTNVTTHEQRLATSTAVTNVAADNGVKVYPNPVTGRLISVDVPVDGNWNYELINIMGQTMQAASIPAGSNHVQIAVPAPVAPGIYYLRLLNNGKQVTVKSLDIK